MTIQGDRLAGFQESSGRELRRGRFRAPVYNTVSFVRAATSRRDTTNAGNVSTCHPTDSG
jgi:hypothetical protein